MVMFLPASVRPQVGGGGGGYLPVSGPFLGRGGGGATPVRTRTGGTPSPERTRTGIPHITGTGHAAGGMPVVVTQKDCLVDF